MVAAVTARSAHATSHWDTELLLAHLAHLALLKLEGIGI